MSWRCSSCANGSASTGTPTAPFGIALALIAAVGIIAWYNNQHHHGGLGLYTAADVHYGRAAAVQAGRAQTLTAAYHAHPERFVRKPPAPPKLPGTSWINPPQDKETGTQ